MKRGRKSIPIPDTPEEAGAIAKYGVLGTDPWMNFFQGNPFIHGKAMAAALKRSKSDKLSLEDLRTNWALRFGRAMGNAIARKDMEV